MLDCAVEIAVASFTLTADPETLDVAFKTADPEKITPPGAFTVADAFMVWLMLKATTGVGDTDDDDAIMLSPNSYCGDP